MTSENTLKLAFYDSGIGGLSVLREFLKFFIKLKSEAHIAQTEIGVPLHTNPTHGRVAERIHATHLEIFYLADSARAPYGARSMKQIESYVYEFLDFAANLNLDYFISACNTSSNLFENLDFSAYKFKILNLFSVLNNYLSQHRELLASKKLLYAATVANIASGKYKSLALEVEAVACPRLVPLIEKREFEQAKQVLEEEYLKDYSEEIKEGAKLILGCTHYALIKQYLSEYQIIDPAELILNEFKTQCGILDIGKITLNTYSTGENSSLMVSTKELTCELTSSIEI